MIAVLHMVLFGVTLLATTVAEVKYIESPSRKRWIWFCIAIGLWASTTLYYSWQWMTVAACVSIGLAGGVRWAAGLKEKHGIF